MHHHPRINRHDLTLGDPSAHVRVRGLETTDHDIIYRSFVTLLSFFLNLMWWALSAACALVCILTWTGAAGSIVQLLIVFAFAAALAVNGFLKTANVHAAGNTFMRTWFRVGLMIAFEIAVAQLIIH